MQLFIYGKLFWNPLKCHHLKTRMPKPQIMLCGFIRPSNWNERERENSTQHHILLIIIYYSTTYACWCILFFISSFYGGNSFFSLNELMLGIVFNITDSVSWRFKIDTLWIWQWSKQQRNSNQKCKFLLVNHNCNGKKIFCSFKVHEWWIYRQHRIMLRFSAEQQLFFCQRFNTIAQCVNCLWYRWDMLNFEAHGYNVCGSIIAMFRWIMLFQFECIDFKLIEYR